MAANENAFWPQRPQFENEYTPPQSPQNIVRQRFMSKFEISKLDHVKIEM